MCILTENYCDECNEVVHAVFDERDFYAHKIGTIRCPACGHIIMPCNECEDHDACGDCPWSRLHESKASAAMSDEAYIHYLHDCEPKFYKMFRDGEMGDHYAKIIEKIEKEAGNV